MSTIVYPFGKVTVTVPAGESIAVYSRDESLVYRVTGYVNQPTTTAQIGTVSNGQTVFGSYSTGATIIIEAGAGGALYEVGTAPVVMENYGIRVQPDPVAVNVTGSVSAAAIIGGIVTSTTAAGVTGTVPTGTVMDAAAEFAVNDAVNWSVINTGPNTFTVQNATDHTLVGTMTVATGTSGSFRTRKTAANTFVTYRL